MGLSLDSKGCLYETRGPLSLPTCPSEDLVSLEDLLSTSPEDKKRRPLTDEERYLLAVTLASSLLQLHTTPWLGGHWRKQHILFSEALDGDATVVDIHHPVISQTYGCAAEECEKALLKGMKPFDHLMQDSASLLALAKILLEIKLNDRFERQRHEKTGAETELNEASDIQTLMQWMTEEKGNLSFTYRDVVSHCIKCSVDPSMDLRDLVFRQSLVDKIVVPLLEELHYWQGGIGR